MFINCQVHKMIRAANYVPVFQPSNTSNVIIPNLLRTSYLSSFMGTFLKI